MTALHLDHGRKGAQSTLLAELGEDVATLDYLPVIPQEEEVKSSSADGGSALEYKQSRETGRALSAAQQQQQRSVWSRRRRRREGSVPPLHESIKAAVIDSKVCPFVATVLRGVPPALGRVSARDFRPRRGVVRAAREGVRVLTWNVERGYRLNGVIASLRNEGADLCLLSEVDVGCGRSQMVDVGAEIAHALGMCLVFATEKIRVNHDRGPGSLDWTHQSDEVADADAFDGVEGVAVLSCFDVVDFDVILLPDASRKNDPRKQRLALRVGCRAFDDSTTVDVVSLHLDAFAGRSSRVKQFQPVLEDWVNRKGLGRPAVIGGDFNTHNHGVTCLHPGLTGDDFWLRRLWRGEGFQAWNQTEAEWWQQAVFQHTTLVDPFDKSLHGQHNTNVHLAGVKLWGGKLDWLLYDSEFWKCTRTFVSRGNLASDHPYLRLDLELATSGS